MNIDQLHKYEKPEVTFEPPIFWTNQQLWDAAQQPNKPSFVFDVECYPNYWCVGFKCTSSGRCFVFERDDNKDFNPDFLQWFLDTFLLIGYNNKNYDEPQLWAAIQGFDNNMLKGLTNAQINSNRNYRLNELEVMFDFKCGYVNSIDLSGCNPCPKPPIGVIPLKTFAARMNCRVLQELPYHHDQFLSEEEKRFVMSYNINDLEVTDELFKKLKQPLNLRYQMGTQYGEDLRSRSDPQLAETLILNECENRSGHRARPIRGNKSKVVQVDLPDWLEFGNPQLSWLLKSIRETLFVVDDRGYTELPDHIAKFLPRIGDTVYKLGIGGLHSQEKNISFESNDDYQLIDRDVASYYPTSILNCEIYPPQLGDDFQPVFRDIYERRLQAKIESKNGLTEQARSDAKSVSDSLKIALNGTFGKLGSPYSPLYSPESMLKVTLTGQLALLMLIEQAEFCGIKIISANTDGIVAYCRRDKIETYNAVIEKWEEKTAYKTEETLYKGVYSASVNSYIAIKEKRDIDGRLKGLEAKAKGAYYITRMTMAEVNRDSLMKSCMFEICPEAVTRFLLDGEDIETTIRSCKDITKFTAFKKANSGARLYKTYLGKLVRWYISKKAFGSIVRCDSGNRVSNSTGGLPVMVLPKTLPKDIDYEWYIKYARKLLKETGYYKLVQKQKELF